MVQRFELPVRHPKKPVQKSRRPRNLRIPKRHHCFSTKRRLRFLSLRCFKRTSRHRIRTRGHRDASAAKIHKSQPPDLTPPNETPSSSPQPESVSAQPLDGISTEGLPSPLIPLEGTTFHPSLDATSLTSEQPQVHQGDTANTPRSNEDEGFIDGETDYTDYDTDCEGGESDNGRVYDPGRKYHFPIDDRQRETEFQTHLIWAKYSQVWQERLNFQKIHNVLDIGSGACYWADDLAFEYPRMIITGVDLFPRKGTTAPNVQLMKEDVEEPWLARDKYDFIHSRDMALAIRDWDTLLNRAFYSLKPGGSIVVEEIYYSPQSKDGNLHSTAQPLADFFSKIAEGLKVLHVDLHAITSVAAKMQAIGFENVTINISYITISHDTHDGAEETAMLMKEAIYEGLQGTALGPLTRGLGWGRENVEVYLVGVRNCLRSGLQDTRLPIYTIHAQRP